MDEIKELDSKYLVLKWTDITAGLNDEHIKAFVNLVHVVDAYRRQVRMKSVNEYVVLNLDDKIDLTDLSSKLHIKNHTPQRIEGDNSHRIRFIEDIAVDIVNSILKAKDALIPPPNCNGEFNGQLEKCLNCAVAVECYERN